MRKHEGTKTICDVVDYEKDIKPFPLIKIYSGVGSGKSYFATAMIKGSEKYRIPKHNVLIVTSRRSKVEETLKEMDVLITDSITKEGNLNFDVFMGKIEYDEALQYQKAIRCTSDWGEFYYLSYNKSVVCTNAYLSAFLKSVYDPHNPVTHLWNRFDAIIVDEVHSLITDATYQTATFGVLSFIREYLRLQKCDQMQPCACKHLILMTGTPQPLEKYVDFDFPQEKTNTLDLFEKCKNVVPENVIITDQLSAIVQMKKLLKDGEKVVYFTNFSMTENAARDRFDIPETISVGVTFSREEKRKALSTEEQEKINFIDKSITEFNRIPDDIQLFITTSRNKEGINIHNKDVHNMFVETHLMYDAVQMAGRVRSGIENFYIVSDAMRFDGTGDETDKRFAQKIMVADEGYADSDDEANRYLLEEYVDKAKKEEWSDEDTLQKIRGFAEYIESRFAYVRFNVFDQKFEFFNQKEIAENLTQEQNEAFDQMVLSDENTLVEEWFPYSAVRRELPVKEYCALYLKTVIGKEPFVRLTKEELRKHLSVVRERMQSKYTSYNLLLHQIDYRFNCIESGNKYVLFFGTKDPRPAKKPMGKKRK